MTPPVNQTKDINALRTYIATLKRTISETSDDKEGARLANHVSYLSQRMIQANGFVVDNLTGDKYYLSSPNDRLRGGGPIHSKASNVDEHKKERLCQQGKNAYKVVEEELSLLNRNRFRTETGNRTSRIIIENNTPYPLVYRGCDSNSGYFFSDAISAFQIESTFLGLKYQNTIPPKNQSGPGVGGIFHSKITDTACSSSGYVAFMIPTEGLKYVALCGWNSSYRGNCSAAVEIRCEDGQKDEFGNIRGHGVEPSWKAANKSKFINKTPFQSEQSTYKFIGASSRYFEIECEFTNVSWNKFIFRLKYISTSV